MRRTEAEIRSMEQKKAELEIMPPIDFWATQEDEEEEEDKYDRNKDLYVSVDVPFNPESEEDDRPTYTAKIKVFKNGTPEQYCAHRAAVTEVATKLGYFRKKTNNNGDVVDSEGRIMTENQIQDAQARLLIPLSKSSLRGHASRVFEKYLEDNSTDEDERPIAPRILHIHAWNSVAVTIFQHPREAAKVQKRYLREGGLKFCGPYTEPRAFYEREDQVNGYLQYYPLILLHNGTYKYPSPLPNDEVIEILDKARTNQIRKLMLANKDNSRKYTDTATYAKALQEWYNNVLLTEVLEGRNQQRGNNNAQKRKQGNNRKNDARPQKKRRTNNEPRNGPGKKKPCTHCGRVHPGKDSDCWSLARNKNKRPDWFKDQSDGKKRDNNGDYKSKKDFDTAVSRAVLRATKQIKAQLQKKKGGTRRQRGGRHSNRDDESLDNFAATVKQRIDNASDSDGNISDDASSQGNSDDGSSSSDDETASTASSSDVSSLSDISEITTDTETSPNTCYANSYAFYESSRKAKKQRTVKYTAETVVEIEDRYGKIVPIRCLVDTGTSDTIVLRQFVKRGRAKSYKGQSTRWNTLGGQFTTKRKALIDFKLPELDPGKKVTWICHVDEHTSSDKALYDMIIGMDMMTQLGIYVNTEAKVLYWEGHTAPLKNKGSLDDDFVVQELYAMNINPVLKEAEERHARILDADYSKVDINDYCKELQYLSIEERQMLADLLNKFPVLFGGGLGQLNIRPVELHLKPGSIPYHGKAYPVPQSLEGTTRKEVGRLTGINVFERNSNSEWAAPTFIQPKKTGDVRILTDFRRLNDCIIRKPFPLPKIQELLQKLRNFKYATAIDLSMGYYHIPLSKAAQKLCTTILPWGKYRYKVLPMGIKNSPDIFQEIMTNLFGDLEYASTYLDDILILSNGTFEDHLKKVHTVLARLQKANFRANVRKCFFAQDNLEYLGYQITREGIQPQPKKVEAIQKIKAPKNVRQLRHFLGMVNYYRDMWKRRSHILAPLTKLVGKGTKWQWDTPQIQAFEEIKRVMSKETILAYPNFEKPFHIYTDASDYQLGAVIMQDDKPLAFYSRKLNAAQKNYTTGEQELLSIVETVKEFRTLLWGQELIVHTDHKNIIYGNLSNDRITRWRLLLEEYSPTFVHVRGVDNVVADALSRLDKDITPRDGDMDSQGAYMAFAMSTLNKNESVYIPDARDPLDMAECYAKKRDKDLEQFPMHPDYIAKYQQNDTQMRKLKDLEEINLEGIKLMAKDKKIYIPKILRSRIVAWYHLYLRHPGATRLEKTLRIAFWWPDVRRDVEAYTRKCHACQKNKKVRRKYGKLPAKEAEPSKPWDRVNIDLIGTLKVHTPSGEYKLDALTMIDPATGWFEIKELPERTANMVAKQFDDCWLSRYPRPRVVGFDNGGENKGLFDVLMNNYGMKRKPTTKYNPQSNGIVERVHAVLNDMLRTFEIEERELDSADPWTEFLSAAAFAIRATYHTTLEATPAQLVFGRDMVLPISIRANWARIKEKRQEEINRNNRRENKGRIAHTYHPGDKILLKKEGILRKLASPREGPYKITRVYNNGTVQIQRGAISERVNIRRITPYNE